MMTEFKEALMKSILEAHPIAKVEDVQTYTHRAYQQHLKFPNTPMQTYVLEYTSPKGYACDINPELFAQPIKAGYWSGVKIKDEAHQPDNLPEQDVIVHERKPLYQPEVMPESEYANRRACIYDSMKATANRRHMVARACTNHREFDFTVNGVKQAVNYILSMAGKEYKQYLPNAVPSFSEYRNSTVGYNKLINVVIECTKTGYKQGLTLGVIGDKVWVLTDAVRYMRKSLNEGRARHLNMLAIIGWKPIPQNQEPVDKAPESELVEILPCPGPIKLDLTGIKTSK